MNTELINNLNELLCNYGLDTQEKYDKEVGWLTCTFQRIDLGDLWYLVLHHSIEVHFEG